MASRDGIVIIDLFARGRRNGNRWWARVWDRRSRTYATSRTFPSKEEARRWAVEVRGGLDKGIRQAGRPSLAVIGKVWADEVERRGFNRAHVGRARRLLQQLADARIDDLLSPSFGPDLAAWLKALKAIPANRNGRVRRRRPELTNATKNRLLSMVKAIVHFAMRQGTLATDPTRGVGMLAETRYRKQVFSVTELHSILSDQYRDDPYWLAFAVMIYTGMRCGEALHVRWDGIQFDSQNIVLREHPDFSLKTDEERHIPLQPELADILRPLRRTEGWVIADDAIRNAPDKLRWSQFIRFLRRCGLEPAGRSPHSTRHSWVSMMLATGCNLLDVKDWAGHRNLTTTERYAGERGSYRTTVAGWPAGALRLRHPESGSPTAKLSGTEPGLAFVPDESIEFSRTKSE